MSEYIGEKNLANRNYFSKLELNGEYFRLAAYSVVFLCLYNVLRVYRVGRAGDDGETVS